MKLNKSVAAPTGLNCTAAGIESGAAPAPADDRLKLMTLAYANRPVRFVITLQSCALCLRTRRQHHFDPLSPLME